MRVSEQWSEGENERGMRAATVGENVVASVGQCPVTMRERGALCLLTFLIDL